MKRICILLVMFGMALPGARAQSNVTTTGGTTGRIPQFTGSSIIGNSNIQDVAGRPLLTLRQQRLRALIAKGWTNKKIASHLNLSENTVRNHVHRIMKEVDATSRSQAVERCLSHGYALTA